MTGSLWILAALGEDANARPAAVALRVPRRHLDPRRIHAIQEVEDFEVREAVEAHQGLAAEASGVELDRCSLLVAAIILDLAPRASNEADRLDLVALSAG